MAARGSRKSIPITSAAILAGETLPVHLNLRLRFAPSHAGGAERHAGPLHGELHAHEARVLKWLKASDANRRAFLKDPLGALERAKLGIRAEDLAALRRMTSRSEMRETLPQGVVLGRMDLAVSDEPPPGLAAPHAHPAAADHGRAEAAKGGKRAARPQRGRTKS